MRRQKNKKPTTKRPSSNRTPSPRRSTLAADSNCLNDNSSDNSSEVSSSQGSTSRRVTRSGSRSCPTQPSVEEDELNSESEGSTSSANTPTTSLSKRRRLTSPSPTNTTRTTSGEVPESPNSTTGLPIQANSTSSARKRSHDDCSPSPTNQSKPCLSDANSQSEASSSVNGRSEAKRPKTGECESPLKQPVLAATTTSTSDQRPGATTPNGGHKPAEEDKDSVAIDDWEGWSDGTDGSPLVNRVWTVNRMSSRGEPNDDASTAAALLARCQHEFTVASYNILSEYHLKNNSNFPKLSPEHWERQTRHRLLMEELKFIDADILCLQEVDQSYADSCLLPELKLLGYDGRLSLRDDESGEGVATYYRCSRFREVSAKSLLLKQAVLDTLLTNDLPYSRETRQAICSYLDEPNSVQLTVLQCRASGRLLGVSNLHATYARHTKPDLRCVQVTGALWKLLQEMEHCGSNAKQFNDDNRPPVEAAAWILCGDFNSTPQSVTYQVCRDGYPSDQTLRQLQTLSNLTLPLPAHETMTAATEDRPKSKALVNLFWPAFQHPCGDMISCYHAVLGREPPLTLNLSSSTGCVDYIWCSGGPSLRPLSVLLPRCQYLRDRRDRLPNAELPSDHLSLAARLAFVC